MKDAKDLQIEALEQLREYDQHQRMCVSISVLEPMKNGDWKRLKQYKPDLVKFIKGAISLADKN